MFENRFTAALASRPRMRTLPVAALCLSLALVPFVAATDPLAGLPAGSFWLDEHRYAVPLKAESPAWYTPDVHAKVLAAGAAGNGFDVERGVEVPLATQYLFIRPGAWMLFPAWCTMSFVHGSAGSWAIGSAGHCAKRGDEVVIAAAPSLLVAIGKVSSSVDGGIGKDWSLTRIAPQFQANVDPDVAVVGGPQGGAYAGSASLASPVPVKHFGHGLGVGTGGTPRAGVSWSMDTRAFYWDSPSAPGDSGSAVLAAGSAQYPLGQAVGILTHLIVDTRKLPSVMAGTRVTAVSADVADGNGLPT